ncbi:lysozyme [Chitinimonas sp. PSY-7]|uniref:glycoside hydrolase family protein n=1 Tax=Chitinimonas sp. PSY-7 TaxID=3459088 RepID=UPI004040253F
MSTKARFIGAGAVGMVLTAALLIAPFEGEVRRTYADPLVRTASFPHGIPTACFGQTGSPIRMGRTYSAEQCAEMLVGEVQTVLQQVDACMPGLPPGPRAAFTSLAYNVGASSVCGYRIAELARQGDYPAACKGIETVVYVAGKDCRDPANRCSGIVKRRNQERAVCEGRAA